MEIEDEMTDAETLADINKLDAVVAELGIQDSFIEPVDALRRALQQASSQAIDDAVKVVREELVQQQDMSGCDETFSRQQLAKYRFAADRLSVVVSRLESLKVQNP